MDGPDSNATSASESAALSAARRRRSRQGSTNTNTTGRAAPQSVLDAAGYDERCHPSSPSRNNNHNSNNDTTGIHFRNGSINNTRTGDNDSVAVSILPVPSRSDSPNGGGRVHVNGNRRTMGINNSRKNSALWKRTILCMTLSFMMVWMTIMTLLVAKLASEQQQQGGRSSSNGYSHLQSDTAATSDAPLGSGSSTIISNRIDDNISDNLLQRLAVSWRLLSCGRPCWGRTYTYTDAVSGAISMASIERFHGGNGSGGGGDISLADGRHFPRGPVFYATSSMLPYAPAVATATTSATTSRRAALQAQWQKQGVLDPMLRVKPGEEAAPQDHDREPYVKGDCVPMQRWQVSSFPNCNAFHELNMMGSGRNGTVHGHGGRGGRGGGQGRRGQRRGAEEELFDTDDSSTYSFREDSVDFLGRGWFRAAWKVDFGIDESDPVVLKTLRLEREFYDEYYELHRKDAVAMERLTPSPYVIDIYGYCGQSAINELADFFEGFTNLQAFARQLQSNNDEQLLRIKLQISIMMALGIAHIHEVDGQKNATMVHYDINPKNVAIVKGGKPKINDFNTVEFLRWNRVTKERCGFRGRLHEPWWRAPEELIMPRSYADGKNVTSTAGLVDTMDDQPLLDEKIDVWSLGNLLYNMLTGHAARGQARTWRYAQVREDVLNAKLPWRDTDAFYLNSTQPAIVAMRRAVERCIVNDPKKRWSALDVAYEMVDVHDQILAGKYDDDESEKSKLSHSRGSNSVPLVHTSRNNNTDGDKPLLMAANSSRHHRHTAGIGKEQRRQVMRRAYM